MQSNPQDSNSHQKSPVIEPIISALEARFANRDGVGLLMERLHPEALQWLDRHFRCNQGCQSGRSLVRQAPIFDARIDLWWRNWVSTTQCSLQSRSSLATALFVTGLSIPVLQPSNEEEWTVQELEDYLASYNHLGLNGSNSEIDPEGFSSSWPRKFLGRLIQLCPSLQLTLHSVKRLAEQASEFDSAEGPASSFSAMKAMVANRLMGPEPLDPNDPPEFPSEFWLFLYAGAIAGGVHPGTLGHPYPQLPRCCQLHNGNDESCHTSQQEIPF